MPNPESLGINRTEMRIKLQQQERWEEFGERKKDLMARCKLKEPSAYVRALWDMGLLSKDPGIPLPDEPVLDGEYNLNLTSFTDKPPCSETDAVLWVGGHIKQSGVTADMAPSPLAWHFLQWARKNENEFWKIHFPKVALSRRDLDEDTAVADRNRSIEDLIAEVERFRDQERRSAA
jgi:hypothetical protein